MLKKNLIKHSNKSWKVENDIHNIRLVTLLSTQSGSNPSILNQEFQIRKNRNNYSVDCYRCKSKSIDVSEQIAYTQWKTQKNLIAFAIWSKAEKTIKNFTKAVHWIYVAYFAFAFKVHISRSWKKKDL